MATRLLRIWRTSKARFCGSALRGAWKGEKGVPAVDRGGAGGGVVIVVSVDTVETRDRAQRSQLDFMAAVFMCSVLSFSLIFLCIQSTSLSIGSSGIEISLRISELYKQELRVSKHEIQWQLGYRQLPYLFFLAFHLFPPFKNLFSGSQSKSGYVLAGCHHFNRGGFGFKTELSR